MLFNSYEFIFCFLPLSLAAYFILNRLRLTVAANSSLLLASLVFYSWWDVKYLPLILGSILFNYTIGTLLVESGEQRKVMVSRRGIFVTGVVVNILFLGYFKYMDFFIGNINGLFSANFPLLHIILPLGISFFTITQIAFLVDAYEGLVKERNLLSYALFVTFFPHLLAGPILHHKEMMPQFDAMRSKVINHKNMSRGIFLFSIGLFKKVMIADYFSPIVRAGFDNAKSLNFFEAWVSSLAYTCQLYFDFSGYSDMAVGIGLMFNILLPINFNSPYKALNVIDFWKRWHMTLSRFITTYLYSPIIRLYDSATFERSMLAIFLAMFISGIWHGAGWTFIIWGALHGAALVVNHSWNRRRVKMPKLLAWLITFNFINFSMVLFRSADLAVAWKVYQGMTGFAGFAGQANGAEWTVKGILSGIGARNETVPALLAALVFAFFLKNSNELLKKFRPDGRAVAFVLLILFFTLLNMGKVSEFLYFQF